MSLQNTTAKYIIEIVKQGAGAAEVSQELDRVAASATRTATAGAHMSTSLKELSETTHATHAGFKALESAGLLLGSSMAPQATMGVLALTDGMKALKAVGAVTGLGLGAVGIALVGVAAAAWIVVEGIKAVTAGMKANESEKALAEQQVMLRERLLKDIERLKKEDKLSGDQAHNLAMQLREQTNQYQNLKTVIAQLRVIDPDKDRVAALQKLGSLRDTLTAETLDGYAREGFVAQTQFEQRKKEIKDLQKEAGLTNGKGTLGAGDLAALNKQAFDAQTGRNNAARMIEETDREITRVELTSSMTREEQAKFEFDTRMQLYLQLKQAGEMSEEELTKKTAEEVNKRLAVVKANSVETLLHIKEIKQASVDAMTSFASGMSSAIVDFVSGTKSAGQAFRDFAQSFLKQVAQMILEMAILNAIKSGAKALGYAGGGVATADALGGVHFAANGIQTVSSPTYFPKFNVVAGEAGREMLTVLARPRMMSIGGMEAVVGQAGNRTLAITDAGSLAGGGAGGRLHIEISHSEESKARIVEQSVKQAEIHLTRQATSNSAFRANLRKGDK